MEPPLSKMLIASVDLGCSDEILTVAAMLSVHNVFYRPKEKQAQADSKKAKFHQLEGDNLTFLTVYNGWRARILEPLMLRKLHSSEMYATCPRYAKAARWHHGSVRLLYLPPTSCSGADAMDLDTSTAFSRWGRIIIACGWLSAQASSVMPPRKIHRRDTRLWWKARQSTFTRLRRVDTHHPPKFDTLAASALTPSGIPSWLASLPVEYSTPIRVLMDKEPTPRSPFTSYKTTFRDPYAAARQRLNVEQSTEVIYIMKTERLRRVP